MAVGELCNREVVVGGPDQSISAIAHLMREHHVGDVVLVEDRAGAKVPVGIVTDRDLVVELLGEEVDPEAVAAKDIMTRELLTVAEGAGLIEVVDRMRDRGVRRVPVVDGDGGLVGILAADDLMDLFAEQLGKLVQLTSRERRHEEKGRR